MKRILLTLVALLSIVPLIMPLQNRCQRKMFAFDADIFPFAFEEPMGPFEEYEQIYAGEELVFTKKPITGISGCIKVQEQTVRYGAVCNFLSIKAGDEWLIAGWAEYSEGTCHYYIKWQTFHDGFGYKISEEPVELGQFKFVLIEEYIYGTNQWWAGVGTLQFNALVTFAQRPNEFMAYTKSLYRGNDVFGDFTALCWRDFDFESHHWGNNSAVELREEYPYVVYVTKPYWEFKTRRNCFHWKGSTLGSDALACLF